MFIFTALFLIGSLFFLWPGSSHAPGSKAYWPCHLAKRFFVSLRALFYCTGIAWRWIFNPETGINLLFDGLGINHLITSMGGPPFKPGWTTDPAVLFSINGWLGNIFPAVKEMSIQFGVPVALFLW